MIRIRAGFGFLCRVGTIFAPIGGNRGLVPTFFLLICTEIILYKRTVVFSCNICIIIDLHAHKNEDLQMGIIRIYRKKQDQKVLTEMKRVGTVVINRIIKESK